MHRMACQVDAGSAPRTADALTDRFVGWLCEGRGDGARGRHRQVLMLLETAWSRPGWPLHGYRPRREPGAFVAFVADLVFDLRYRTSERALGLSGPLALEREQLRAFLRERLAAPWRSMLDDVRSLGWRRIAEELEAIIGGALPAGAEPDLPLATALERLGFEPGARGDEHHPVAGDLRAVVRRTLDGPWSAALDAWTRRDLVGFLAAWPVDPLALVGAPGAAAELRDLDFAVFYARVTDGRAPGRRWSPPAALVPPGRDSLAHFMALSGRLPEDADGRREQRLQRLGLSTTFPTTVTWLDACLASAQSPVELAAGAPWLDAVEAVAERIDVARRALLASVSQRIGGTP